MPTTLTTNLYTKMAKDLDLDSSAEQIDTGAKTIFGVSLDNSQNVASNYVKFYNSAAPSVGTTSPEFVVRLTPGQALDIVFGDDGAGDNTAFATALSIAGVTTGGTAGSTPPANDLLATVLTN